MTINQLVVLRDSKDSAEPLLINKENKYSYMSKSSKTESNRKLYLLDNIVDYFANNLDLKPNKIFLVLYMTEMQTFHKNEIKQILPLDLILYLLLYSTRTLPYSTITSKFYLEA